MPRWRCRCTSEIKWRSPNESWKVDERGPQGSPRARAGAQRIGEVALRPRMAVDRVLDRHHFGEIAFAHRLELGEILEGRAHRLSSSRWVNATLSLRYTGTANAASTPSPAASRGAANCATAIALGCTSGSTLCNPKLPYAAKPFPAPIQPSPGGRGAACGATHCAAITSRHRVPSYSSAA